MPAPESPIFGGTPGETMRYGGHGFVALVWASRRRHAAIPDARSAQGHTGKRCPPHPAAVSAPRLTFPAAARSIP
jgi:hypothetical protein